MDRGTEKKGIPEAKAIRAAFDKCLNSNQQHVYLYLPNHNTNQDKIEIRPGIEGEVLVHGQRGGHGRKSMPTIIVLKCSDVCVKVQEASIHAVSRP